MGLRACMITNGFTEAEIQKIEGPENKLDNAALLDVMSKEMDKMSENVRQAKIQMLIIDRGVQAINTHPDGPARGLLSMLAFDKTGKSGQLSVDLLTDQYARFAYRDMNEMMQKLMPNWKQMWKVDDTLRHNIVREIFGKATGDADAAKFAKSFTKANENLRIVHNKLGGNIKKNDQWYMPQTHNAIAIRKVSRDEWVNGLLDGEMLDYQNMTNRNTGESFQSAEELRPALESMYDGITTNGASKMDWDAAQFKDIKVAKGAGSRERFLKFKDGDSWLKYQAKFGEKDIYSSMVTHIQGLARETAMVKNFGPNSGAAYNYLRAQAGKQKGVSNRLLGRADNVMKELTGELSGMNNQLQYWAETLRSIMTFKLGSASISSLSDHGTIALTAKINGLPIFGTTMKYLKNLADGEGKLFLLQSGVNADFVIDIASGLSRYSESDKGNFFSKISDRFIRASGLNAMTEAGIASIQLSALGHLANVEKLAWKDLSTGNLAMLKESGINEADWKIMSRSKKHRIDGAPFLDMRELPIELQMKVGNMMDVLSYRAVPAPDVEVQAILRQGTESGTVPGEAMRSGGQFKSFLIAINLYHANVAIAMGPKKGAAYVGGLLAATTMMGALSVQIKEMVNGREAMDSTTPNFWLKAFLQGGGAGIYGDLLFADHTRYGNSLMATLGGPTASAFETVVIGVFLANTQKAIVDIVEGNPDVIETLARNLTASATKELKKTLPTQLWYTKLAVDRYIYSSIMQMADPDYIKKLNQKEAKLQRDEGRGNLFEPFEL